MLLYLLFGVDEMTSLILIKGPPDHHWPEFGPGSCGRTALEAGA
jgi:hypothetical protein